MKKLITSLCAVAAIGVMSSAHAELTSNTYKVPGFTHKVVEDCEEHYSFNRAKGNLPLVEVGAESEEAIGKTGTRLMINSDYKLSLELTDNEPRALVYRGIDASGHQVERIAVMNTNVSRVFEVPTDHEQIHIGLYKTCAFIKNDQ